MPQYPSIRDAHVGTWGRDTPNVYDNCVKDGHDAKDLASRC